MRRLLPALPGPAVLNAGAGAGSLTLRMVEAGLRVTSVDASERALRLDAGRAWARRAAGNPVLRGDLQRLDLPGRRLRRGGLRGGAGAPRRRRGRRRRAAPRAAAGGPPDRDRPGQPVPLRLDRPLGGPPAPLHRGRCLAGLLEGAGLDVRRGRRMGLPADGPLPPPGLPPRPAPPPRGRRRPARRAAARRGSPPGWCGPPSRSTRRSSAAAPATTACSRWRAAVTSRSSEAVGRPSAGPCGAGEGSPPACWCSASSAGRWSTAGRRSPSTTGTSSRSCSRSASS